MLNIMTTAVNKRCAERKSRLNILTLPTHEGYQTLLSKTGHNFYMLQGNGIKKWDYQTRPLPPNHYIFNAPIKDAYIPRMDLILSQDAGTQYGILKPFAQMFRLPIIQLYHTSMLYRTMREKTILSQSIGDINVFITENNKTEWGNPVNSRVIEHAVDHDIFTPVVEDKNKKHYGVCVVNKYRERSECCGFDIFTEIQKQVPIVLYGDNGDLSESINNSTDLNDRLNNAKFFLNTTRLSPLPMSMLEAMAAGLPIVTTATKEIPNVIKHGENGFLYNTIEEAVQYSNLLLENSELRQKMGTDARSTILNKFGFERFINQWNGVFDESQHMQ